MKEKRLSPAPCLPEETEYNLSDFALFLSVMKNCEAHRNVLSIITGEPDLKLAQIHVEEVVLNRRGRRAIRLDAWAVDAARRQFGTEMQNDTGSDDVRKRARYYQSLLDAPFLKSGKKTRYRELPSTYIIFITQEDIFGKDQAKYTFTEQCEEVPGLHLEDGTVKLFLNMASKRGDPVLVSLLQYMKLSRLDNPEILVRDERIVRLDEIVREVKKSEEWEDVKMSILSVGIEMGRREGEKRGIKRGEKRGERRGIKQGKRQGEEKMAKLIMQLNEDGRLSDIIRISQDEEYRQKLYMEYHIM